MAKFERIETDTLQPPEMISRPPSLELRLRIQRIGGNLKANLHLPEADIDAGPFLFTSPLTPKDLAELRWYLEMYWRWPVGPDVARAARLEQRLQEWGKALLKAALSDQEALRLWQQFRDQTSGHLLLTLDSTEREVLSLPWELLADEEGHLFALGVSLRRRVHRVQATPPVSFTLPVHTLMVVARPEDERTPFIDPRSSPQALLEAVAPLGSKNVVVEFLYPPTLQALDRRLRDRKQPPVHVVHFDGHGVYQSQKGLGYLAFEDDQGGLDLVDANRLGTLLSSANVPLIILDACQSAYADTADPFTSLAPRLIQARVGNVVAMQYSVLSETTRRFFVAFYRALAEGCTVGQAMDEGRRDLLADTKRLTLYRPGTGTVALHLRDWFLPVLYQQAADLAPFTGAVIRPTVGTHGPTPLFGDFPETRYLFTGRARKLWELERLLRKRRRVVVHSFGGEGKTALASEAAHWLTRIGLFARALFLSFEAGGDAAWAVMQMGRLLQGDNFSALPRAEHLPALKRALVEKPALIIWDNCESVLPGWPAELSSDALKELLDLGVDLTQDGQTRLVLTTRDPEIPHSAYVPSQQAARLELGGLIPSEALAFAGEVLDTLGHERPEHSDLERLLNYLGDHPLSIQLVLPHLQEFNNDVVTVIARFDEIYPGFTEGKARERNESLDVSLSFSLSRLSEATRERLLTLGVFEGGAMENNILTITGLSPAQWNEAKGELLRAGLVREERLPGIRFAYYTFHPTLCPYLWNQLPPAQRKELEERYRRRYYEVSDFLYQTDRTHPHQARIVALKELPNLRRALDLTLAARNEASAAFVTNVERFLDYFGRWREREALVEKLRRAVSLSGSTVTGPLIKAEFLSESSRGELLLDQGRAGEAEQVFRKLLERMNTGMAYGEFDAAYDRAVTLIRLGRSLVEQGRPYDAEAEDRRALNVLAGLDQEHPDVRRQTRYLYTDLATMLTRQGRYAEAQEYYERSLKAADEEGDERSAAVALGQLGELALQQRNYDEAWQYYQNALKRFHALGEIHSEAVVYHQLGTIAMEAARRTKGEQRSALLAKAENAYRESLCLNESIGGKAGAITTANHLAIVATMAGRPADAERWYHRAIELGSEIANPAALVGPCNNLADLLLSVHNLPVGERPPEFAGRDLLAEAEVQAHRAREIMESIDDLSLQPWNTYSILARIAVARGDIATVRPWRHKERSAFAAFPGNWARLAPQGEPVVQRMVSVALGDIQARQALEAEFEAVEKEGWQVSGAFRRIWAGERDWEALTEGIDRNSALIVKKVLEALAG